MLQVFGAALAGVLTAAALASLYDAPGQVGLGGLRLGMTPAQVRAVSKDFAQLPYPVKGRFRLGGKASFDGCDFRAEVRGAQVDKRSKEPGGVGDIDLAYTHGDASACAGRLIPRLTQLYGPPDYRVEGPGTDYPSSAKGTRYWWQEGRTGLFVAITHDARINPIVMSVVDQTRSDSVVH